jgi:hypothetical protein
LQSFNCMHMMYLCCIRDLKEALTLDGKEREVGCWGK